jgi:hypothetical protein
VSGEGAWSESPDQADYWAPLYHPDENAVKGHFLRLYFLRWKMIPFGLCEAMGNH